MWRVQADGTAPQKLLGVGGWSGSVRSSCLADARHDLSLRRRHLPVARHRCEPGAFVSRHPGGLPEERDDQAQGSGANELAD